MAEEDTEVGQSKSRWQEGTLSLERLPKGQTTDSWEGTASKDSAGSWGLLMVERGSRRRKLVVDTRGTE